MADSEVSMQPLRAVALVALAAVVGAGCTSEPPAADPASPPAPPPPATPEPVPTEAPEGVYRLQGCEPRSLLPALADTPCGGQVVAGLFSQLVALDPEDGTARWGNEAEGAVAAEVESIDARRWEVELKPDWEFHDGSEVTASSFVDAWNFAAHGANAQASAHLFEPIVGFNALNCPEPGCEPVAEEMTGLRAIDEETLEIVLRAPDRLFPQRLAHLAFSPLPPAAIEDPEGFGEAPVGNGSLRMEGAWDHDRLIALRPVEDHPETAEAGVDVVLQGGPPAALRGLDTGLLDVATAVPDGRQELVRETFATVERTGGGYDFLVVPSYLPTYGDDRLAVALSRAIDRQEVIDEVLAGAAEPARDVVPPVVLDEVDRCGDRCRFDPRAARRLLAEVELPPRGLRVWIDTDAVHEGWVRAVVDQWRRHLQLGEEELRIVTLPHSRWLSHLQDQRIMGLHPLGWTPDVISPTEYLEQMHARTGMFNFDDYAGEGVTAGIRTARAARTPVGARAIFGEVAQQVVDDMHHVPLWFRTHEVFHGDRVATLELDLMGRVDLASVELSE